MSTQLTPAQFIAKWSKVTLSERAASQEHFIDLCRLLAQPTPAEYDGTGAEYTSEKSASVDSHPRAGVPHGNVAQPPSAGEVPHGNVAQPPSAGEAIASQPHPGAGVLHDSHPGAGVPHAKDAPGRYRRNLPHIQPNCRPVFVTFCTRDRWVLPEPMRSVVMEHCLHDHRTKLHMHGLVVMPDHVHMVFTPLVASTGVQYGLAEIMNGIKGASAHRINRLLRRKGSVWQDESFDHILRRNENAEEKVDYICSNPIRKGLVTREDDYTWLWREWVDDVPHAKAGVPHDSHPGAGVPHGNVAQPPSAGEARASQRRNESPR